MSLFVRRLNIFLIVCILAIYFALFFAYALNVPKWDDFALIQTIKEVNLADSLFTKLQYLCKQHNEHRIFFTRVFAWLDYSIFGQLNFVHLMLIGSWGLLGIFGIFLLVIVKSTRNYFIATSIALMWFTLAFYENSFWGMASVQNFWIVTWVLLLFFRLSYYSTHFLIDGLIAFAAVYTSGNGLLLIPIVGLFYLIHVNFKKLTLWGIFSILLLTVYFWNYSAPPDNAHPNFHLTEFVKGVFVMSGSIVEGLPFNSKFDSLLFTFGGLLFFGSVFVISHLLFQLLIQKKPLNSLDKFVLLSMIFCVSTILLVSFSRVGTYGVYSLIVSRYKIYAVLLASLLMIYFSNKFQLFNQLHWQGIILVFCLFWYVSVQHYFLKNVIDQRRFLSSIGFSFFNYSRNSKDSSLNNIYQQPPLFFDFLKFYRKSIDLKRSVIKFNENHALHWVQSYYDNQNLRDEGLFLLLVNENNCYVFPFIQSRKHSIRNLFNYSSFFNNSAELALSFKESDIFPGVYEMKLLDHEKITDFQNSNLLVPKVFIQPVVKNW
jgi:hypothetical protein